jgi:hypothetical protein
MGLASPKHDHGAIAREIGAGEVWIEATVFDAIAGVMPGRCRGSECQRIGERVVNNE